MLSMYIWVITAKGFTLLFLFFAYWFRAFLNEGCAVECVYIEH